MDIGRKIYYDINSGQALLDTGERSGDVVDTTPEDDFAIYTVLSERIPETVGFIRLEYGQFREDFFKCNGFHVNIHTKELQFSYPSDGEELEKPVYVKPLTERISNVEDENADLALELAITQARLEYAEEEQASLILLLVEGGIL